MHPMDVSGRKLLALERFDALERDARPSMRTRGRARRRVGGLLVAVTATAPPDRRGFHPWGMADRTGFPAMGIVEAVAHARQALDEPLMPARVELRLTRHPRRELR